MSATGSTRGASELGFLAAVTHLENEFGVPVDAPDPSILLISQTSASLADFEQQILDYFNAAAPNAPPPRPFKIIKSEDDLPTSIPNPTQTSNLAGTCEVAAKVEVLTNSLLPTDEPPAGSPAPSEHPGTVTIESVEPVAPQLASNRTHLSDEEQWSSHSSEYHAAMGSKSTKIGEKAPNGLALGNAVSKFGDEKIEGEEGSTTEEKKGGGMAEVEEMDLLIQSGSQRFEHFTTKPQQFDSSEGNHCQNSDEVSSIGDSSRAAFHCPSASRSPSPLSPPISSSLSPPPSPSESDDNSDTRKEVIYPSRISQRNRARRLRESLGSDTKLSLRNHSHKEEDQGVETKGKMKQKDDTYYVESIVDKRYRGGKLQYRIKWLGWSLKYCSWELAENITHLQPLIQQFENTIRTSGRTSKAPLSHRRHSSASSSLAPSTPHDYHDDNASSSRSNHSLTLVTSTSSSQRKTKGDRRSWKSKRASKGKAKQKATQEDSDEGEEEEVEQFMVEKIIGRRNMVKGSKIITEYRVEWTGYPTNESTWETHQNIAHCSEEIKDFEKKLIKEGWDANLLQRTDKLDICSIDRLIGKRQRLGVREEEYLVKWEPYPLKESTWEIGSQVPGIERLSRELYKTLKKEGCNVDVDNSGTVHLTLQAKYYVNN